MREPEFIEKRKTKNPILRGIGNFSSLISAWALLKYVYAEEDSKKFKCWIYFTIFKLYNPFAARWATVYEMTRKTTNNEKD